MVDPVAFRYAMRRGTTLELAVLFGRLAVRFPLCHNPEKF